MLHGVCQDGVDSRERVWLLAPSERATHRVSDQHHIPACLCTASLAAARIGWARPPEHTYTTPPSRAQAHYVRLVRTPGVLLPQCAHRGPRSSTHSLRGPPSPGLFRRELESASGAPAPGIHVCWWDVARLDVHRGGVGYAVQVMGAHVDAILLVLLTGFVLLNHVFLSLAGFGRWIAVIQSILTIVLLSHAFNDEVNRILAPIVRPISPPHHGPLLHAQSGPTPL